MSSFIKSIGDWFVANKDAIVVFLTSAEFIGLATTIFTIIGNNKATNKNTLSNDALNKNLQFNEKFLGDVNTNMENTLADVNQVKSDVASVMKECEIIKEQYDVMLTKLDAMLEVQALVYSTIKDDTIRSTVQNLIITAKHAETAQKAKIKEELERLRNEVTKKSEEVAKAVSSAVNAAETIIETSTKPEPSIVQRG